MSKIVDCVAFLKQSGVFLAAASCLLSAVGQAQIVTDGSVGSAAALAGPNYAITADLGRRAGGNLFHSFGRFDIGTGESATFSGPADISNVISRVTGGTTSNIDGLIRSTIPEANLYLFNPAGLAFGPNASLDIKGSFFASTADRLVFRDGRFFSASDTGGSGFTVAAPEKFGFLNANPAQLTFNQSTMTVPAGERIAVVGGDITITGGPTGLFSASGGRIDMVSVASAGEVDLTSPTASVGDFAELGAVSLSDFAFFTVSGTGGGEIFIRGGKVGIENSTLIADTSLFGGSAVIDIEAGDTVQLGAGAELLVRSQILGSPDGVRITGGDISIAGGALVDVNGTGSARITITGGNLLVDQAVLTANTDGLFSGAGIVIDLTGDADFGPGAGLLARNTGNVGAPLGITLSAQNVSLANSVLFLTETFGAGPGGATTITAADTLTIGDGPALASTFTGLFGNSFGSGPAGATAISASELVMNGGTINARALGLGPGGPVSIDVTNAELRFGASIVGDQVDIIGTGRLRSFGTNADGLANIIQSTGGRPLTITIGSVTLDDAFVRADAGGIALTATDVVIRDSLVFSAGSIQIAAETFTLGNNAGLTSAASGTADGGDIIVNAARSLLLDGTGEADRPSISAAALGDGNAGAVKLTSPELTIRSGTVSNAGSDGSVGGTILLSGERITLTGRSQIEGSSGGAAPGTDISIVAGQSITLSADGGADEPLIQSSAFADGPGGTISLNSPTLSIVGGNIAANSGPAAGISGIGGTINLTVNSMSMENSAISASGFGPAAAGSVNVFAGSVLVGPDAQISTNTLGTGQGGIVNMEANSIVVRSGTGEDQSLIAAISTGFGNGGEVDIKTGSLTLEQGGAIQASAFFANGGTINIQASERVLLDGSIADTSRTAIASFSLFGDSGAINITTPELIMIANSTIEGSSTVGNGAEIVLNVGRLDIGANTAISAFTDGSGTGGNILIEATQEVSIAANSGIITPTLGTGPGGNIQLSVASLILNGGVITSGSANLETENSSPTGPAGDVVIAVGQLILDAGAKIDSSTSSSLATGTGGGVTVTVTGSAVINGVNENGSPSAILTNTTGAAAGGTIIFQAHNATISDRAVISSTSTGSAEATAGDIFVSVAKNLVLDNGAITTEATRADGGNITIKVGDLVHLAGGKVTTTVASSTGDGGNIDIDPIFLVLIDAEIIADAVAGDGGNIQLTADNILLNGGTTISASSELGIDGSVVVDAVETDVTAALKSLNADFLNAATLLAQQCAQRGGQAVATLTATGRGALPSGPDSYQHADLFAGKFDFADLALNASHLAKVAGSLDYDRRSPRILGLRCDA